MIRQACLASLFTLAIAPALAHSGSPSALPAGSFYHDWLSGWSVAAAGDHVRYGLDPETGEWGYVAIPDPIATFGVAAEPIVIQHADGSTEVINPSGLTEYLVARVGPDGRLTIGCATPADLTRALATPGGAAPDR